MWPRLLYEAEGYLASEVRCEIPESRQYRVRDFWCWHRDFENFRRRSRSEYERFEGWLVSDGLIQKEQFLGAYYEQHPGDDEGELVSG
jgi:hypothetical protein